MKNVCNVPNRTRSCKLCGSTGRRSADRFRGLSLDSRLMIYLIYSIGRNLNSVLSIIRLSNQTLALDMKLTQEEALSKRLEKYFDRHVNPVRWVDMKMNWNWSSSSSICIFKIYNTF